MKRTVFDASYATLVHSCDREGMEEKERERNKKLIHTITVKTQLANRENHPLLDTPPPEINHSEIELSRGKRRQLAQLRARKCPLLRAYLHNIGQADNPICPLCTQAEHTTAHLFVCPNLPTMLTPEDLWRAPKEAADLVSQWEEELAREADV